ncbi:MAG: glycosyltransferase, partial [Myxococcales bacterium]|nr:glycosyltransferase [Myxococcales bacterium]
MDVSVLIVSWRVPERLRACLRSIEADPFTGDREVWIVDNASGDGTPEMIAKEFPSVNLIANGTNVGFPKAVNQALEKARGRVAFLLNPDARVAPGATATGLAYLAEHPDVGVLGARVVNEAGVEQAEGHRRFPTLWTELCEMTTLARRFPRSPVFNRWRLAEPAGSEPTE